MVCMLIQLSLVRPVTVLLCKMLWPVSYQQKGQVINSPLPHVLPGVKLGDIMHAWTDWFILTTIYTQWIIWPLEFQILVFWPCIALSSYGLMISCLKKWKTQTQTAKFKCYWETLFLIQFFSFKAGNFTNCISLTKIVIVDPERLHCTIINTIHIITFQYLCF